MMRENIFLEDIEIPEIVQEKADIAFSAVKMEGMCRENMKKENWIIKRKRMGGVAAVAACAAVVVTAGFFAGSGRSQNEHADIAGNDYEKDDEIAATTQGEEQSNLFDMFDKMFTLKVKVLKHRTKMCRKLSLNKGILFR